MLNKQLEKEIQYKNQKKSIQLRCSYNSLGKRNVCLSINNSLQKVQDITKTRGYLKFIVHI